jgi:hypothetical protein
VRHRAVLTVASVVAACVAPDDDGEAPVPLIASEELRIGSVDDSATALTYVIAFGAAVLRGSDSAGGRGHALALASFYRPPALPPVSSLLLGRDGSVWLRRENTGAKESAPGGHPKLPTPWPGQTPHL